MLLVLKLKQQIEINLVKFLFTSDITVYRIVN